MKFVSHNLIDTLPWSARSLLGLRVVLGLVFGTRFWCARCPLGLRVPSGLVLGKYSNLVDSASSHTLVSKIKPCMSKYKSLTLKLRTAHYISYSLFDSPLLLG